MTQRVYPRAVLLALAVGAAFAGSAHAQEPVDSDAWKTRCLALNTNAKLIEQGSATADLLATTRGIAGNKFSTVAHERGAAGQHYIACTLYYTAAMAERMGNGGKVDPGKSHSDVFLGGVELKRASGQPLSFKEKMETTSGKVAGSVKSGSLSPVDVAAVFAAFPDAPTEMAHPAPGAPAPDAAPQPNSGGFNPTAIPKTKPKGKA